MPEPGFARALTCNDNNSEDVVHEARSLSLFAVQSRAFEVMPETLARHEDVTAAYWQSGSVAYVLVAQAGSSELAEAAALLSIRF